MKVLLLNPQIHNRRLIPMGLCYIASVLRDNGHNVKIFDPPPYDKITLKSALKSFKPDIAGLTATTPLMLKGLQWAKEIKENSDIPVLFGGVHPTSDPIGTLSYKDIDYIVIGEGELTIPELVDMLEKGKSLKIVKGIGFKEKGKPVINPRRELIENLDELPYPARDLLEMRWYTQRSNVIRGLWIRATQMMTSRGCLYNCIYCASKLVWGRRFRYFSYGRVVDEMEMLVDKYKVKGIHFTDDTFSLNKQRVLDICNEIVRRKLDIKLSLSLRVDRTTDEIVRALKRAGCVQIQFGIESGSQKVLNNIKKGTTVEQAVKAMSIVKKYNIRTLANMMVGNPGETLKDIEMSRKLAHKLNADFIQFFKTTPYPGTELYDMAVKNKWIDASMDLEKFQHGSEFKPVMSIHFTPDQIKKITDKLNNEFTVSKVKDMISNPLFWFDLSVVLATKPGTLPKALYNSLRTRNLETGLRIIDGAMKARKFP